MSAALGWLQSASTDEIVASVPPEYYAGDTVRQQVDAGLDVVSDGEMGKPSFITYAAQRLDGLEKRRGARPSPFAESRETADFPDYYKSGAAEQVSARRHRARMVCAGPTKYKGHAQLKADLEALKMALKGVDAAEAFVPAIAPSNIETTTPNRRHQRKHRNEAAAIIFGMLAFP